ncbi:MAG: hypothetical protein EAZ55_11515 [Cytophagales bacterium]|nr:MAG: hypothetical protein EAZ55_11515 [Cytophagales bacterium]
MRKVTLLTLLLFLSTSAQFILAQGKEKKGITPEEFAQKRTDEMNTAVGLQADQRDKIYAANLQFGKDRQALMQEIKAKYPTKEARQANKEAIKTEFKGKRQASLDAYKKVVNETLNEEQKQKWKAYKQAKKQAKGKGKTDEGDDEGGLLGDDDDE